MTTGATIFHLLDSGASEREPGTLGHADAVGVARASERLVPHCRHRTIDLPRGGVLGATVALRRVSRPADGRGLVHCYSRRGASAARLAFGRRWPIVLSVGAEASEVRPAFGIAGPDRLLRHCAGPGTGWLPLGGDAGVVEASERESLRRSLGIAEGACVVGALAEPRGATNARWLVFFAGILVAGGLDLTVLVPREAGQVARMRRFHATTRLSLRVILVERGAEIGDAGAGRLSAWNACDVAIARPDPHARGISVAGIGRAIRRSHLAGVPVIAAREIAPESLYPGEVSSELVVSAGTTKQIARALTTLIEGRELRERVREGARRAANATVDDARLGPGLLEAYGVSARGWLRENGRSEVMA